MYGIFRNIHTRTDQGMRQHANYCWQPATSCLLLRRTNGWMTAAREQLPYRQLQAILRQLLVCSCWWISRGKILHMIPRYAFSRCGVWSVILQHAIVMSRCLGIRFATCSSSYVMSGVKFAPNGFNMRDVCSVILEPVFDTFDTGSRICKNHDR